MSEPKRGRFITLEGGEGTGKSTQAHLLGERMRVAGLDVVVTREPGGTRAGEKIRAILLDPGDDPIAFETEALLMSAARAEHVAKVIEPALARGAWVISDRYVDSTYAYQGGARGLSLTALRRIQSFATHDLMPDLTILLELAVAEGLERRNRLPSSTNRLDAEAFAFHERVRSGYDSLAKRDPERWFRLSATPPVEIIAEQIWREFSRRFRDWLPAGATPSRAN